jgi:protein involved in polysaccharide export with SLBB domain
MPALAVEDGYDYADSCIVISLSDQSVLNCIQGHRFMSLQWIKKLAAATCVLLVVLFTNQMIPAGPQEQPESLPNPQLKEKAKPAPAADVEAKQRDVEAEVNKMLEAYDLRPHPEPAIPDDPPPHEGAMVDAPEYVIEPPDLVLVEVLEALPGRPISGERLVRPDGTISLGFYGEVHVRGLTIRQAKVKIIKHLRRFLSDELLGLIDFREENLQPGPIPNLPEGDPVQRDEEPKPKPKPGKPRTVPSGYRVRSIGRGTEEPSSARLIRPTDRFRLMPVARQEEKKAEAVQKPVSIPLELGGQITIKIEIQPKGKEAEAAPAAQAQGAIPGKPLPPDETNRVFVDVTALNSKHYFVEGDVGAPGQLPFTGRETVLQALHFASGLIPSAEPKDIHLVRPAGGGKPSRIYKVDLEAIRDRGDVTANYQLFPGDRLVVGRNDVVKKTIELDRLAAPMQTVFNSMLQESFMARSMQHLNPQDHDAILKDLVEFWIQEMKRPEAKLDEQTLREALIKRLQIKPDKK